MDIFEYAMQMEKDGEKYYRQTAEYITNKGLKTILTMLADDEVRHFNAIKEMQTAEPDMSATTILTDAANVFTQMQQANESFNFNIKQTEMYRMAQDIEERSRQFYLDQADKVELDYQKKLFLRLADEEKKHFLLLENMIDFVSRPEQWLENAEFCHLEEY